MSKIVKNTTGTGIFLADTGNNIPANGQITIDPAQYIIYASSTDILPYLNSGDLVINDGSNDLSVSDAINTLRGFYPKEVAINQFDAETGGIKTTNKFAPDGWLQRLHEIEFTSSTVGGAIHDKDYNDQDYGWSSVKYYESDGAGGEQEITGANASDQSYLDANCIRSDFLWMPDVDYMILSGVISQFSIPTNNLYMWGLFMDADPALGVSPIEVLGGGLNMKGVNARDRVGLKGVSGSTVYYAGIMAPSGFIVTPPGMGTNRIRFIFRHTVGVKHTFQSIFEIFRESL